MALAVKCEKIAKSFHAGGSEVVALRGVDLAVEEGEFMMLVGPSGCGKTTLISIIAGILQGDTGLCEVLGTRYGSLRPPEMLDFRAENIGFIFQSFNLLPSLTLAENVAVPLIINGMNRHDAVKRATHMLGEVGLSGRENATPGMLSGGQQQRVAIARALVHAPRLLVCDEPTSALDHETGMRIMDLMTEMNRRRGTTLIVVTHDNRIFHYAHRIAHMDDGRVDSISSPASPTADAQALFHSASETTHYSQGTHP
jgi:putative ABC transport system ATP-binding protein